MGSSAGLSAGYAAIGTVSVISGTAYAVTRELPERKRSLIQHGAAGTVLAGLVIDVFPKLQDRPGQVAFTTVGLLLGLGAMLAIRRWAPEESLGTPGSLVVTVLVDVLVDGVLIGLSVAIGPATGLLFAVALAPEMFLLGASASAPLGWSRRSVLLAAVVVGAGIAVGGALGWLVAQAGTPVVTLTLGVGASAIMYLVLEELLRESHQQDIGPIEVAVLFGAFLPFFLAGILVN